MHRHLCPISVSVALFDPNSFFDGMYHAPIYLGHVRSWTWKGYRRLQFLLNCLPAIGLAFVLGAVRANYHDRKSLEWPTVSGTIMQCEAQYHRGWKVSVSYRYQVNGQPYVGNCVSLWNPNGAGSPAEVNTFVADHPVRSNVIVYYHPQHPEIAVLEPGADEGTNRLGIWCGSIIFALLVYIAWRSNRFFNKLVAWRKANPPKIPATRKREKISAYPHGYVSYEPAEKQKLNCFSCRGDLDQFIGRDDKAYQEWKPDDRVIDAHGREFRLVPRGKKHYDLEPTGQTWTVEKLLDFALADAQLLKKDTDAMRRRVMAVPEENRIPVLLKCIDMGSRSGCVIVILFLVLFFFAVFFGGMWLLKLLEHWTLPHAH